MIPEEFELEQETAGEQMGEAVSLPEIIRAPKKQEAMFPFTYKTPPGPSLPVDIGDFFKKDYSYAWGFCQKRDRSHQQTILVVKQLAMMLRQNMPKEEEKEAKAWVRHFKNEEIPFAYRVALAEWQHVWWSLTQEMGSSSEPIQRFRAYLVQAGMSEKDLNEAKEYPLEQSEKARLDRVNQFAAFKSKAEKILNPKADALPIVPVESEQSNPTDNKDSAVSQGDKTVVKPKKKKL